MSRQRIDRFPFPDAAKLAVAQWLRRHPTPAERHAWSLLRNRGILGLKFRRQHVLQGFIVDLYCPQLRLVVELDGAGHATADQTVYDAVRTTWLRAHGYRVLRLGNRHVNRETLELALRRFVGGARAAFPLSR